jgi:hypothetical protein
MFAKVIAVDRRLKPRTWSISLVRPAVSAAILLYDKSMADAAITCRLFPGTRRLAILR